MLERRSADNGVVYYRSPLLSEIGVPHAFSTRIGGISPAPFDSLNLGNPSGCSIVDDYDRIWQNYRLLATAAGCGQGELLRVHQVHGSVVAQAEIGVPFDTAAQADAIVLDHPGRIATVRVADCVPVLLADESGERVAAVHAGWRGVVSGVVVEAIKKLRERGARGSLTAAIGPCISMESFEVGPEVLEEFRRAFENQPPIEDRPNGKGSVDLSRAIQSQLNAQGVAKERIDITDRCTFRDAAEFYSHRRERGVTGRMAAIISVAARG